MARRLRFRGESCHKVDNKGRVSIPASFRRVLEAGDPDWEAGRNPNLVIVYGDKNKPYLECFTVAEMERIEDTIARLPRASKKRKVLELVYSTRSVTLAVDETGRIVLSKALQEKAGISDMAQFASALDRFEIWNPEKYTASKASAEEAFFDEVDDDFDLDQLLDEAGEDLDI